MTIAGHGDVGYGGRPGGGSTVGGDSAHGGDHASDSASIPEVLPVLGSPIQIPSPGGVCTPIAEEPDEYFMFADDVHDDVLIAALKKANRQCAAYLGDYTAADMDNASVNMLSKPDPSRVNAATACDAASLPTSGGTHLADIARQGKLHKTKFIFASLDVTRDGAVGPVSRGPAAAAAAAAAAGILIAARLQIDAGILAFGATGASE